MFGFFKRTKIEIWETELLKSVFIKLSGNYVKYLTQIENGLLKGVLVDASDIPNYVGFTYNPSVYSKFYESRANNFKLSGIKVKDSMSGNFVEVSVYFSYGVINGYSIDARVAKFKLVPEEVNIDSVKRVSIGEDDFNEISKLLTSNEIALISKNDVYITSLRGKDYYHLKELEDGDFIGIDLDNNIYKITHDPFEITLIERGKLESLL